GWISSNRDPTALFCWHDMTRGRVRRIDTPPHGPRLFAVSSEASPVLQQTPLHAEHVRLGARMVDFGGWSMPVQYSGIMDEHQTVRTTLGAFDISHMGQFFANGPAA